jgi:hypothetical protein
MGAEENRMRMKMRMRKKKPQRGDMLVAPGKRG